MALGRCSATVYPKGEVPIVQLSIDETQPPSFHHEIGQRLASLREEGVLITGSGNVVHRLHAYAWGRHPQEPYEWTVSFEKRVRELLLAGEHQPLVDYQNKLGSEARLAAPTPDHYLPLLYVIGTRTASEPVTLPVEGVDGGSISMLAVQVVESEVSDPRPRRLRKPVENAEKTGETVLTRRCEFAILGGLWKCLSAGQGGLSLFDN